MDPIDLEKLNPEQQARLALVEQEALALLNRKMREGRATPRRHMRVAFIVLLGGLALVLLLYSVISLF